MTSLSRFGLSALLPAFPVALAAQAPADSVEARIARIEHGLRLPVAVRGETGAGMALPDRMKFYQVPGVSIAVLHRGSLASAGRPVAIRLDNGRAIRVP